MGAAPIGPHGRRVRGLEQRRGCARPETVSAAELPSGRCGLVVAGGSSSSDALPNVAPVTGADRPSQPTEGLEPLLSIDEVTRVLRISESGVYRLVRNGELARVKVGSRTLFEPSDVRRFIEERRQTAVAIDFDEPTLEADRV